MVKLFESKLFNIALPIILVLLLVLFFFYGYLLGITDVPTLIANSILMFLSTLIAISLPLHAARKGEEERKAEEQKMVYVSVSEYVGNEIFDNMIVIDEMKTANKKTEQQLIGMPEHGKHNAEAGMWGAVSEMLIASLNDKWHQNMVASGLVAKMPDNEVSSIRDTYQKMDNLIRRLRGFAEFSRMYLTIREDAPEQFRSDAKQRLNDGIAAIKKDIEIFEEQANKTVDAINKFLKPYGKQIKIVAYGETKKKE